MEEVKNKLLMSLQKVGINKIGSFEYFFPIGLMLLILMIEQYFLRMGSTMY